VQQVSPTAARARSRPCVTGRLCTMRAARSGRVRAALSGEGGMNRECSEVDFDNSLLGPDERLLLGNKSGPSRLGFAVLLKFFQAHGRFPRLPQQIPRHLHQAVLEEMVEPASGVAPKPTAAPGRSSIQFADAASPVASRPSRSPQRVARPGDRRSVTAPSRRRSSLFPRDEIRLVERILEFNA
jgi:hypothetical protein